jgi:hypothetical protein
MLCCPIVKPACEELPESKSNDYRESDNQSCSAKDDHVMDGWRLLFHGWSCSASWPNSVVEPQAVIVRQLPLAVFAGKIRPERRWLGITFNDAM